MKINEQKCSHKSTRTEPYHDGNTKIYYVICNNCGQLLSIDFTSRNKRRRINNEYRRKKV